MCVWVKTEGGSRANFWNSFFLAVKKKRYFGEFSSTHCHEETLTSIVRE